MPPSRTIKGQAWNLIGYYGAEGMPGYYGPDGNGRSATCALNTLSISLWDPDFQSLWTYWELTNPYVWYEYGLLDYLDPGAGYWVFAPLDGTYTVSTTCW
jgi:hypothetical protein